MTIHHTQRHAGKLTLKRYSSEGGCTSIKDICIACLNCPAPVILRRSDMSMRRLVLLLPLLLATPMPIQARVVELRIERREPVLNGKPFGLAGAYEKLSGKVEFALDPALPQKAAIID